MAQTSIHLRPCKHSSEIHNKREKELDYVRTDLSQYNEWWSAVSSLGELRSEISALVKEKTKRKMQAKAEPLREGVIVIQKETTMEQLQELGRRFQERFGVTPVQIAIHRDEGHWKDEEWKPNLHAHIVFDWYDHKTGKSIKTSKLDAAEMQTITAEVLGMERGVSSDKKHLDAARYKAQYKQKEIEELSQQANELADIIKLYSEKKAEIEYLQTRIADLTDSMTIAQAKVEGIVKNTLKSFIKVGEGIFKVGEGLGKGLYQVGRGYGQLCVYAIPFTAKKKVEQAEEERDKALDEKKAAKEEAETERLARQRADRDKQEAERAKNDFISKYSSDIEVIDDKDREIESLSLKVESLEEQISHMSWRERMIEKFISFGATLKSQWDDIFKGKAVTTHHIVVQGVQVPLDNPIFLRLNEDNKLKIHDGHWLTESGFWYSIKKGTSKALHKGNQAYKWVIQSMGLSQGLSL